MTANQKKLGVLLLSMACMSTAWAQDQSDPSIVGSLQQIEGLVLIKEGETSVPAAEGQLLRRAQSVLVTEGAKALVVFNDGCDMALDPSELYSVPGRSPCASLWMAAPVAAGVGCAGAHASDSSNSRALAAVGLAVGAGLMGTAQGREEDYEEYAAALEIAQGTVMARNDSGVLEVIRPGTRLRADQELVIRDNAKALIRFDDGCTQQLEVGSGSERYVIPGNSPCFTPGLWWASSAAAVGLCVTVEDTKTDGFSP